MVHILAAQVPLYTEFLACVATVSARGRRENWKGGKGPKGNFPLIFSPSLLLLLLLLFSF